LAKTCKVNRKFMKKQSKIKLTIIFDNISYSTQLQTKWGYSCLIKTANDTILFDTGSDGKILLSNLSQLQVDPNSITAVIISHNHWDHLDGLADLLKTNPNVTAYIPYSFSRKIEQDILQAGAKVIRVESLLEITDGIFSLGELNGNISEQSIVIQTIRGMVVITGCAHPGIVNILKHALTIFPKDSIHLAMGGFHLKNDDSKKIIQTVRAIYELNVEHVAPSHCTGEKAIKEFENIYLNNYMKSGVGKKITIEGGE